MSSQISTEGESLAYDDRIVVTGGAGFIGRRVVANLVERGFRNIACLTRQAGNPDEIASEIGGSQAVGRLNIVSGNLLVRNDCDNLVKGAKVVYHLAAGRSSKAFSDAFLNSVVTTRNLLDACSEVVDMERFVNVSSFTVYTNRNNPSRRMLDEQCPVEEKPADRGSAYTFAKSKQEEMVAAYADRKKFDIVTLRPGVVYGPGNENIHGRVGIGTFGVFLHLGGSNKIPFSYVDNCAEAVVLAGLVEGVNGEVFNVVDDQLPSSRQFLRLYKKQVKRFRSIYVPRWASYCFCSLWERYSRWSNWQLPNAFNRNEWHVSWKKTVYANDKLKKRLGWAQKIPTSKALEIYFESCRQKNTNA